MERSKLLEIMAYLNTAVKKPDKHLKRRREHQTNARSSAKRSKDGGRGSSNITGVKVIIASYLKK
jgi:hypothetical protein